MADHRALKNKGLKLDSTEKPRFFSSSYAHEKVLFFFVIILISISAVYKEIHPIRYKSVAHSDKIWQKHKFNW